MGWPAKGCVHAAVVGLTLAAASLGGCAEPQTILPAQQQATNAPEKSGRLFYIGLAFYSEPCCADRSSFGCAPDSRHTFFGEAEVHAFGQQNRSLHQVFAAIRDDVARMESRKRYQPSAPQVWVGASMTDLYDAPLF